jgi:hypothetical protein
MPERDRLAQVAAEDPHPLVFALCHEAGSLLTALRFQAGAPAGVANDAALRALASPLATRLGALLSLIRPLLDGPRELGAMCDVTQVALRVERELRDVGVETTASNSDASLPAVRCDAELLRSLLLARALAVVEPGESPVRLTLTTLRCERGVAIRIEDDVPPAAEGSSASGVALVERVAANLLSPYRGMARAEPGSGSSKTHFELETA